MNPVRVASLFSKPFVVFRLDYSYQSQVPPPNHILANEARRESSLQEIGGSVARDVATDICKSRNARRFPLQATQPEVTPQSVATLTPP